MIEGSLIDLTTPPTVTSYEDAPLARFQDSANPLSLRSETAIPVTAAGGDAAGATTAAEATGSVPKSAAVVKLAVPLAPVPQR